MGLYPENIKYSPKQNAARQYNAKFAPNKEPVNFIRIY